MNGPQAGVSELSLKKEYEGTGRHAIGEICRILAAAGPVNVQAYNWDKRTGCMYEAAPATYHSAQEAMNGLLSGTAEGRYCAIFNIGDGCRKKVLEMYAEKPLGGYDLIESSHWFPRPPPKALVRSIQMAQSTLVLFHDFDDLLLFEKS